MVYVFLLMIFIVGLIGITILSIFLAIDGQWTMVIVVCILYALAMFCIIGFILAVFSVSVYLASQ